MIRVDIKEYLSGGYRVFCSFTMEKGKVVCSRKSFLKKMYKEPIRNILKGKEDERLTPDAGMLFLENLKLNFRGTYFFAEEHHKE